MILSFRSKIFPSALFSAAFVAFAVVSQACAEAEHHAGAHAEHPSEWNNFLWTLLTFAIYATIMVVAYRKKVSPLVRGRSEQIREYLGRAGAEIARVEAELARVQTELSEIPQEAREIERQFREEGQQIAESLKAQSMEESERILHEIVNQRESALNRLGQELQSELVERAVHLAEERIRKTLTPEDDRRLRNEALTSLAR